MKITRGEEGTYVRVTELEIDEDTVNLINSNLKAAIVNGVKFTPLTKEEVWKILKNSEDNSRAREEYFVEIQWYTGVITLYEFIRCELNNYFIELPGQVEEKCYNWYDEFDE